MQPFLVYGAPLSDAAIACLQAHGHIPAETALPAPGPEPSNDPLDTLSPIEHMIFLALTATPLNIYQTELLGLYHHAWKNGETALSVEEAARRLGALVTVQNGAPADYVRAAIRSFGRRLNKTLERPPVRMGADRNGEGVADVVPSLALFDVVVGASNERQHRLTDAGAAAVSAALAITPSGRPAAGLRGPDDTEANDDEIVLLGMTRLTAALVMRVQQSTGRSLDETIRMMTSQAGAG